MVRVFLVVEAALFLAFGLAMMHQPIEFALQMGMEIGGRHGAYEMRGIYGGVSLGIAGLCLLGAVSLRRYARPALLLLVAYMGGYLVARGVGIHFDGLPEPYFWTYIIFEFGSLVFAVLCLRSRAVRIPA